MRKLSFKSLKYKGPFYDASGLGQSARDFIELIPKLGLQEYGYEHINISHDPRYLLPHVAKRPSLKSVRNPDANLIYCQPFLFNRFIERGKINIGYTMWETDKVPDTTQEHIKHLDALLVPNSELREVFSKLHGNVHVLPQTLPDYQVEYQKKKSEPVTFYSVFEWSERKGPIELFQSYFLEFAGQTDVLLNVKTKGDQAFRASGQIDALKKVMRLKKYPPIEIITSNIDYKELMKIHAQSNCYVSMSRGEGWGLPVIDAVMHNNFVVANHPVGCTEFISDFDTFYPVEGRLDPLIGMGHFPFIDATHNWRIASINDARIQLRAVYDRVRTKGHPSAAEFSAQTSLLNQRLSTDSLAQTFKRAIFGE